MSHPKPQNIVNGAIKEYKNGIVISKITKKWHISEPILKRYVKLNRIPLRRPRLIKEQINGIILDYKQGIKLSDISKKWNVSEYSIYRYVNKFNLEKETKKRQRLHALERWKDPEYRERMIKSFIGRKFSEEHKRKLSLAKGTYKLPNENTSELYYLIGVGLGDASIFSNDRKQIFSLITKDRDFALKFKKCLEKTFRIKTKLNRTFNKTYKKYYYVARTQKKYVVNFLREKLSNLNWISSLPLIHKIEILRGMFDSDGSVSIDQRKHKETLVIRFSNSRYPKIFEQILKEFGINYKKYFQNNTFHFHMLGKNAFSFLFAFGPFNDKKKGRENFKFPKIKGGEIISLWEQKIKPMLAYLSEPFDDDKFLFEVKISL